MENIIIPFLSLKHRIYLKTTKHFCQTETPNFCQSIGRHNDNDLKYTLTRSLDVDHWVSDDSRVVQSWNSFIQSNPICLVVYLPLWIMMDFVTWDEWKFQLNGKSFKIPWFQSPPTSYPQFCWLETRVFPVFFCNLGIQSFAAWETLELRSKTSVRPACSAPAEGTSPGWEDRGWEANTLW